MDEQTTVKLEPIIAAEPSIYEQMHRCLYDYHFGRITFLELLEKWKEVLQLPTGINNNDAVLTDTQKAPDITQVLFCFWNLTSFRSYLQYSSLTRSTKTREPQPHRSLKKSEI